MQVPPGAVDADGGGRLSREERGAGGSSWSITACGHSGCHECMLAALTERSACPCCKRHLTVDGLYEVEAGPPPPGTAEADASGPSAGGVVAGRGAR